MYVHAQNHNNLKCEFLYVGVRGSVFDLPRRKRVHILTEEMKRFIEEEYKKNDELTLTAIKAFVTKVVRSSGIHFDN